MRGLRERAALKVQATLLQSFRSFLDAQGFTEISTPKIVVAGAEGGANLFSLDYFGQRAYLAQSPQLYKQMMVGVFERVYEVAPVFRAEQHATSRHLNEFISLDVEFGFIESEEEVMALENALLRHMMQNLRQKAAAEFALLDAKIPEVPAYIPRIAFAEALALVREAGYHCAENDLDHEAERLLGQHFADQGSEWVFVTGYPRAERPFYTAPLGEYTRGFDLLFRGSEITSGGQRIHDEGALLESLAWHGLQPEALADYISVFRHGMPPHGGFAIGAERLSAKLLGLSNVRFARAFPRDQGRLLP